MVIAMTKKKRSIVMIVDNCPAHPHVKGLKSMKLVFLPPNTTSVTQPMDQGVIRNLKLHYRKLVIKKKIRAIDTHQLLCILLVHHQTPSRAEKVGTKECRRLPRLHHQNVCCLLVAGTLHGELPMFVIGKSKNPRCFKNVKSLPTEYVANKKAWMTSEIFINWFNTIQYNME
jgi:hypothetical protein